MQTPAEKQLILTVANALDQSPRLILNLGAAHSRVIEDGLVQQGKKFVADRLDVQDCSLVAPFAGRCIVGSAESMPECADATYDLVFANFVLEHIKDLPAMAREVSRILKPGGLFVASLANPAAPEFWLARYTPTWFHQWIKGTGQGKEAYETHYAYRNLRELKEKFAAQNFELAEEKYFPFTYGYLYRFSVLKYLSRAYDALVGELDLRSWMGNACLAWRKG